MRWTRRGRGSMGRVTASSRWCHGRAARSRRAAPMRSWRRGCRSTAGSCCRTTWTCGRSGRPGWPEVVGAGGVARSSAEAGRARGLATVFGDVAVRRAAYRGRGRAGLHPADGALNLPEETYSHGLRRHASSRPNARRSGHGNSARHRGIDPANRSRPNARPSGHGNHDEQPDHRRDDESRPNAAAQFAHRADTLRL